QYLMKRTIEPLSTAPCARPVAREAIEQRAAFLNSRRSELYELALYLVVLYEPPIHSRTSTRLRQFWHRPIGSFRRWLSTSQNLWLLEVELQGAVATLHQKAGALEVQLSDMGLQRLPKA